MSTNNDGSITVISDLIDIQGQIDAGLNNGLGSTSIITLAPTTDGVPITLGGAPGGVFDLTQPEFSNLNARDIFIGNQNTTSDIIIDLVDLSGLPLTDLTLNTTGVVLDSTITTDVTPNIIIGTDRNLFITGGATGVEDRFTTGGSRGRRRRPRRSFSLLR